MTSAKPMAVKICGLTRPEDVAAAASAGARYIGLVFYPQSGRYVAPDIAAMLSRSVPTGVRIVGLFVDPDDQTLARTLAKVPLDMIQLHGSESPVRVAEIRRNHLLPVIKAIPVATERDLEAIDTYIQVSDWLLFDAKTPQFGGSGQSFDWNLLKNRKIARPWMLSGGLNKENVAEALKILTPDAVDVSSGVEETIGKKSKLKIVEFINKINNA